MKKWEVVTGSEQVGFEAGGEYTPVGFPRTDSDRDAVGGNNKGGASTRELPTDAVKINTTGNINVPRTDRLVDYWSDGDGPGMKDGDEMGGYDDGGSVNGGRDQGM